MITKYINLEENYNDNINSCTNMLKNGGIGIFPTDTVYGIGCVYSNTSSINNLYKIKNRNYNKPIAVLISNIDMLNYLVKDINFIEKKLIELFWPGPLTIVFNKSDTIPNILNSGLTTIGIRMPNNKICLDIINLLKSPLAMSSANLSNNIPDTNIEDIIRNFNNKVDFIISSDKIIKDIPSTIVRVENNEIKILREGSIKKSDIIKCFGGKINVK